MQRSGVYGALVVAVLLWPETEPAAAHHCPHGAILRVHIGRCVSIHSSLARGFVHTRRARPERYYVDVVIRVPPAEKPAPAQPQPAEPEVNIPYRLDGSVMFNPAARAAPYWRH
jgi:hypothetical protein